MCARVPIAASYRIANASPPHIVGVDQKGSRGCLAMTPAESTTRFEIMLKPNEIFLVYEVEPTAPVGEVADDE